MGSAAFRLHRLLAALALGAMLLASGCASVERRPPPTLDEVVRMAKEGVAAEEIIRRLRETHAVFALSGSRLAALRDAGVPDPVLDYIQQAYVDAVRYQEWQRAHDWYWWGPPYWRTPYLGYPYRPPSWPPPSPPPY